MRWVARASCLVVVVACGGLSARASERVEDLDGDGRADCWAAVWEGGSGFGGERIEVRPGCGTRVARGGSFGSFAEHLAVTRLDPIGLSAALQAGLRDALTGAGTTRCRVARPGCLAIDGSFAWLLDEVASRAAAPGAARRFTPHWQDGAPAAPPTQAMALAEPRDAPLAVALEAGEADVAGLVEAALVGAWLGRPFGFVTYHTHHRGPLVPAGGCARWDVWRDAHAVAVVDRQTRRWAWAFVSTGGDKLRHPSIHAARCTPDDDGQTITIERRGEAGDETIRVDPALGRWWTE